MEEQKEQKNDFEKAVVKEVRIFVEGLKNYQLVQEADLTDLQAHREN